MSPSKLAGECRIAAPGVLDQYNYRPGHMGKDIGIMLGIIVGYRIAAWGVLRLRSEVRRAAGGWR